MPPSSSRSWPRPPAASVEGPPCPRRWLPERPGPARSDGARLPRPGGSHRDRGRTKAGSLRAPDGSRGQSRQGETACKAHPSMGVGSFRARSYSARTQPHRGLGFDLRALMKPCRTGRLYCLRLPSGARKPSAVVSGHFLRTDRLRFGRKGRSYIFEPFAGVYQRSPTNALKVFASPPTRPKEGPEGSFRAASARKATLGRFARARRGFAPTPRKVGSCPSTRCTPPSNDARPAKTLVREPSGPLNAPECLFAQPS
jgi:hypothetical protein